MCVAIIGRICKLDNKTAVVDYHGNKVNVSTGLLNVNIGDHVLVHAGCAIQKVSEEEYDIMNEIMNEMDR